MKTAVKETGQTTVLPHVSWKTYESLLGDYAGYSGVRLTYDRGVLEVRRPDSESEQLNRSIEAIASTVAVEQDRDIAPYGSTTFRRADLERGFEPDSCFYLEHAAEMRGRTEVDLTVDPAPELVVEIDDTSSSLDKLPLYARLGVREVWQYANGAARIYGLDGTEYTLRDSSRAFPALTTAILNDLITQSRTMRRPEWIRRVREWARQTADSSAGDS
jgi:Uma2 family endonuclease